MAASRSDFATRWSQIDQLHAAGADEVWRWFVVRYHDYVAAVLRRACLRVSDVDDMLDEFWGYLFKSRALVRADRSRRFRAFLSGVVCNFGKAWLRDRKRLESAENPDILAAPIEVSEDDDLQLWSQQILFLALDRLARQYPADALALRRFYGIAGTPPESAAAIARDLQRSVNATHQVLFRARGRLRECLRCEVDLTVGVAEDLAEEMREVQAALEEQMPGLAR